MAAALFEQIAASGDVLSRLAQSRQFVTSREGAPLGRRRKRGSGHKRSGASRGGRTSKVSIVWPMIRGRPVAFALTPGNVADISMAVPLQGAVTSPKHLIADKAYDADSLRNWLKFRRIKAVIPSTATRTVSLPARSRCLSTFLQSHRRAPVLPSQELATPGNTIRPLGQKLSRRARSRRGSLRVDLNESST